MTDKNNNEMKAITFIISSLRGGGAERVLSILANFLASDGYKIDIVYSMPCSQEPAYKIRKDIKIHKIPSSLLDEKNGFFAGKYNSIKIVKHLRKKMKDLDPDVLVSFIDKTNIYSIIAHLGIKAPLIISERNSYDFLKNKYWRFARRVVYPFSDGMVVLSKYDFGKYSFVKNKRIIINPLGIEVPKDFNLIRREKIILAVGRLNTQKGFDMLIKSCSTIDLKDWKVIILGEGEERGRLEHLIKKYSLTDCIYLPGRKDNVNEYYKKASIFVLSSRFEGFPNALAEAMSFGCACIAFDCRTGPSEMIKGNHNGILVDVGDTDALSEKIDYLINNKAKVHEISMQGRKLNEKLGVSNITNEWVTYMKDILVSKGIS